jgi:hypothetical protein
MIAINLPLFVLREIPHDRLQDLLKGWEGKGREESRRFCHFGVMVAKFADSQRQRDFKTGDEENNKGEKEEREREGESRGGGGGRGRRSLTCCFSRSVGSVREKKSWWSTNNILSFSFCSPQIVRHLSPAPLATEVAKLTRADFPVPTSPLMTTKAPCFDST